MYIYRQKIAIMKKFLSVCLLGFLLPVLSFGQGKLFSIKEAVQGQGSTFAPTTYSFLQWRGNSDSYTWITDYKEMKMRGIGTAEQSLLKTDDINSALKQRNTGADQVEDLAYFPLGYQWISDSVFYFVHDRHVFFYNAFSRKITGEALMQKEMEHMEIFPQRPLAAYTVSDNIYVSYPGSGARQVTTDGGNGIVNGSDYVHRQEFGIHKGMFWSPKGNYLAFYRKDERDVTTYPLVNTGERIAALNNIKYPMAGMTSEEVTLGIYNVSAGSTVFLKTGEPKDQYLTAISWDPSEKYVYVGILNRGQDHLKMNQYDAVTGAFVRTLFEEQDSRYVEPENPPLFMETKPDQFIWQSERDGYNHLYLYRTDGALLRQLTSGNWIVTEVLGFDAKEENLFFTGTPTGAMNREICSVNLKSGKTKYITDQGGTHRALPGIGGAYLLDLYSSTTVPNEIRLLNVRNGKTEQLLKAPNPYTAYNMPQVEMVTVTAADGETPLYGRIIRPAGFDATKKYPVIIYVYGGPHAQLVSNTWLGGARLWEYYMAQKGYIMFTLDNRGSANRGMEFESVVHRQLGQQEMADQMKGVEYLKSLPYVDASRIGVHGWSFGGFMTISLLLNHPGVFKTGVAGGPVCDWKWYEVMYGERYMDTPQENPAGYDQTSVVNKAGQLKGKLLVIHGAQDNVVVMQHSMEFIKACIKAERQVDYFLYPDHEHNVYGKDRIHLMEKITEYFDLHLK